MIATGSEVTPLSGVPIDEERWGSARLRKRAAPPTLPAATSVPHMHGRRMPARSSTQQRGAGRPWPAPAGTHPRRPPAPPPPSLPPPLPPPALPLRAGSSPPQARWR
jgi:hypothetical protein